LFIIHRSYFIVFFYLARDAGKKQDSRYNIATANQTLFEASSTDTRFTVRAVELFNPK